MNHCDIIIVGRNIRMYPALASSISSVSKMLKVLLKQFHPADDTCGIHHHGTAIKNQIGMGTYLVHIINGHLILGCIIGKYVRLYFSLHM